MSEDSLLETLTGLVAVATLPLGILAGIFLGGQAAAVVFVVGWLLLVPVLGVLDDYLELGSDSEADSGDVSTSDDAEDDALQRLRERYASGEIDEPELERRLEALLETEDVEIPSGTTAGSTGRERERETEAE